MSRYHERNSAQLIAPGCQSRRIIPWPGPAGRSLDQGDGDLLAKRGSKRVFWLHKPRGLGLLQFFRTDPFCQGLCEADKFGVLSAPPNLHPQLPQNPAQAPRFGFPPFFPPTPCVFGARGCRVWQNLCPRSVWVVGSAISCPLLAGCKAGP